MELRTIKDSNKIVKETRILAISFSIILAISFSISFFLMYLKVDDAYSKAYVFDTKANIYSTTLIDETYMRVYEYENHVKTFFNLWYSFDADNYESNVNLGLELIGDKGKELLDEYNQLNILNTLIQKNIRYHCSITDITVNMNSIPISGVLEGIQTGYRGSSKNTRNIVVNFTLYDVSRSQKNVHGTKIGDWSVKYYEGD